MYRYAPPPVIAAIIPKPALTHRPLPRKQAPRTPIPTGVGGDWKLTFDDEFDGTSLDTARWSTGWYGSGITPPVDSKEIDCYDPAQVTEGGGTLDLTLIRKSEDLTTFRSSRAPVNCSLRRAVSLDQSAM